MGERGNSLLRNADFFCGIPATLPAAAFRALSRSKSPGKIKKICIFCPGAIGDLLLASAIVNGIRRSQPDAWIEVAASSANAAALPLLADVDGTIALSMRRPDKIIFHLRRLACDVLIDTSQWARIGNLVSNFSGAGMTVGFATRGQFRSAGYDKVVNHDETRHELDNFLALGRAVWPGFSGCPRLVAESPPGRPESHPVIYCHMWPAPGKGRIFKQWPEEHWARLMESLLGRGFKIVLTGSQRDASENMRFLNRYFPECPGISSIAGKTSLAVVGGLLKNATALVSVNTGIMHLGALLGTPTVGLHGATNPARWGPVGKKAISLAPRGGHNAYLNLGFEYPRNATPNMRFLPVCDVLSALGRLLPGFLF